MLMNLAAAVQQQDAIVAQLGRMSTALVILAWSMGIVGVLSVVAILVSLYTMRTASRLLATVEAQINRLAPRAEPLLEKVTRLADDARGISDVVRRRVNQLMDTVGALNDSVVDARREAELRIREFAAVLDVVQTEAEHLLLDAAATARGVQVTAAVLRGVRPRAADPSDEDDDSFDPDDEIEDGFDDRETDMEEAEMKDAVPANAESDREDE